MGILDSKPLVENKKIHNLKAIQDIYLMFKQGNKVILQINQQATLTASRIKNIDNLMNELLQPFIEQQKYSWGLQIFAKFKKQFSNNFELIWTANRQQFYQLLLINCHVEMQNQNIKSYQNYFYDVSIHKIQESIPNDQIEQQPNLQLMNDSILMNGLNQGQHQIDIPLFLPHQPQQPQQQKIQVEMAEISRQEQERVSSSRIRMQNCSLLLPETVFVDRLSYSTEIQVSDLLKYYNEFVNTISQLFCSNNLISCPLKHFIFSIQQKILRKKIKNAPSLQGISFSPNEQARRILKTRQQNNNIILYQVKSFLESYTTFVWMYLQLHLMANSRLGKIINSQILYGIIFKSVWGFVDWIADRGYEFEQTKLQEYYKSYKLNQTKLSNQLLLKFDKILEALRKERHPQQYLKKVVIFYREVSKNCQNADQLLMIYEEIIARSIKLRGSRDLYFFRMRNIIQKLLKIDENSMSGGQISYSWTTWCILIELLRQKINYQYGSVIISKQQQSKQTRQNISLQKKYSNNIDNKI